MSVLEKLHSFRSRSMYFLLRIVTIWVLLLPVRCAGQAQPSPVAVQRQSVQAMQAAVARQRAAVALTRKPLVLQRAPSPRITAPAPACAPLPEARINALVTAAGEREGLATGLLRAVVERESSFSPCAVSRRGALGLMQLMPSTAAQFGVRDPLDPKENVDAGARFLKQLMLRYGGDLELALGAYNAGPARVDEAGGVPPFPETEDYISEILTRILR